MLDRCVWMCSDVFMANVHVSLRLDEKLIAEIDAEAVRMERSRNWVISRRLENSRTLPPLYKIDGDGDICVIDEGGLGKSIGRMPRKKIADDLAGVVGENPACAPMGKREYGDYFPVIDTTPVEDKGKVLAKLRGLVAGIENNVLITPTMGADGNFADICSACWGKGTIAGCAECGVILGGDQEEVTLPRCSHVEQCEDGEKLWLFAGIRT